MRRSGSRAVRRRRSSVRGRTGGPRRAARSHCSRHWRGCGTIQVSPPHSRPQEPTYADTHTGARHCLARAASLVDLIAGREPQQTPPWRLPRDTEGARKALITGITGQDGSYLAELLLEKGYEVHGLIRRSSQFNTQRIDHLYVDPHESDTRLFLHYADLTDSSSLIGHLHRIQPDEVYNLGAQSHVKVSFEMPEFTADTAGMGTLRMLEAIRTADWPLRFYQAGSSEMYGKVTESPQTETHSVQSA